MNATITFNLKNETLKRYQIISDSVPFSLDSLFIGIFQWASFSIELSSIFIGIGAKLPVLQGIIKEYLHISKECVLAINFNMDNS